MTTVCLVRSMVGEMRKRSIKVILHKNLPRETTCSW